ncbi:14136_t:CDS:2 [Gigaspora rosea]|nr:14136_t:CDS:2 [Gigaspora rosea]
MSSTTSDESNENEKSEKLPAVLIIGEVGVGKSTVANMIAGKYRGGGPFTNSYEIKPFPVTINGIRYILIDTPGLVLSDEDQSNIDIISQIDELLIQNLDKYLEIVSILLVLVFTKGTDDQTTSRQYMETTFNTELRDTVGEHGKIPGLSGRWVIIPNPNRFPITDSGKENEHILENLSLLNKLIISLTPPKYQFNTVEPEIIGINKFDLERAYILYNDVINISPYRWVFGGFGIASTVLFFIFILWVYCVRINQDYGI